VLGAGDSNSELAREALSALCLAYWPPLYAYARRRGHSVHDAQDLTQAFFARLLEQGWVRRADPGKGRFRTFLLTAMSRFLANEWDRLRAQKRGGDLFLAPLQFESAELQHSGGPVDDRTPEQAFERSWALTLLEQVLVKLEAAECADDRAELFVALKPCLTGATESQPYAELSQQLGLSEAALRVAVHRQRQRYRELLRAEVANTVLGPNDVEAEMRHLFKVLAR
jgi:RNA polymerase sigma-70 factor (ECF subfamily)